VDIYPPQEATGDKIAMAESIRCFVSFSSIDTTESDVRFFLNYLTKQLGTKVKFKAFFEEPLGTDLRTFMEEEVAAANAVVTLLTPDYKRKVDLDIKSGVLIEHKLIADRLEQKNLPNFIPIWWRGTKITDALPEYYDGKNYALDLHKFIILDNKNKGYYVATKTEQELSGAINKLVAQLEQGWLAASQEYKEELSKVESQMLPRTSFENDNQIERAMYTKQERATYDIEYFSTHIFTKTSAYRNIDRYQKSAFTGRKGAGKTTLLKVFKFRNSSNYLKPVDVEVNDWSLHDILGDLTFRKSEGDLSYTALESKIFDYIWPVFLSFTIVKSIEDTALKCSLPLIKGSYFGGRFVESKNRYDKLFLLSVEFVRSFFKIASMPRPLLRRRNLDHF
jgi:hypothetical protein